jgi:hypothetical protein
MTALTEASFEPVVMYVQQSTRRMLSWDIFSEHPAKSVNGETGSAGTILFAATFPETVCSHAQLPQ